MTPRQMIAEWEKGCSCGGAPFDQMMGNPAGTTSPAQCEECTVGLIDALKRVLTITPEQAQRVVAERSNGALIGTSPSKGGRAWLDGEWCLAELEALCILLRHEAGDGAEGAAELLAMWQQDDDDAARLV